MISDEVFNPSALIVQSNTTAEITAMAANAEMGTLGYSSDDSKLIFVINAGGHEHVTSA